jgi:hypothetical protein
VTQRIPRSTTNLMATVAAADISAAMAASIIVSLFPAHLIRRALRHELRTGG